MSSLGLIGESNLGYAVQAGGQAAGGIASVAGGYAKGAALDAFGNYSRDIASHNAEVATATAEAEVSRIRYETRQQLAVLRTQVHSSGVRMSGTPLSLLAEEAAKATYQKQLARYGGKVNAQQAIVTGQPQAFQYRLNAESARQAGLGGMFASFGQAAGSLLQIRHPGAPDPTSGLGDAYTPDAEMYA